MYDAAVPAGYGQFCPVALASETLTQRWMLLVVRELCAGATRFSEIRRGVPGIAATLHNESLVSRFTNKGAPYAAEVVLDEDASTSTGYRWAVGQGPTLHLSSGTLAKAETMAGSKWSARKGPSTKKPHMP